MGFIHYGYMVLALNIQLSKHPFNYFHYKKNNVIHATLSFQVKLHRVHFAVNMNPMLATSLKLL